MTAQHKEMVTLVRELDNTYLNLPIDDEDSLLQLQGASVSYRIALGPQQGQKVFTLQILPAGVFAKADKLAKLEWQLIKKLH